MRIPLLDLKAQYQTIKKDIDDVLIKIAESQHFILGPEVEKLEKNICEYLNCKHAVGVSSGTDALLIALMAIGIKPGDEVILPTYSFFATAGVVARMNAFPVFTDIESVTFNIKPEDIEKKITSKTKAIIPVHLYGQSAEMREINEIARKYDLKVIEDGAQAIGAQYRDGRNVGNLGDIGCFSFFPSKNLGCFGDGGMVTTNNDILYEKIKILRVHGGKPKYFHKIIGGNFRLDAIQAAVLNVKLPHLNEWSEKRRQNAYLYNKLFIDANLAKETGVTEFNEGNKLLLPKAVYENEKSLINHHIYNQYVIRVEQRDELRKHLTENEIGTEIYYPVPFHRQECFAYLNCRDEDYTNSNFAAEKSIALPIYPELTEQQIEFVVCKIKEFIIDS
ncbi:MAG: DegT/DnrJ/EryC1/StrS family aminotransferase [Ignavibacteria bacterium]|nr:DegT/DnrJ/EryC1/StrS family aminotransferase [Ignavibacteria bacterium]